MHPAASSDVVRSPTRVRRQSRLLLERIVCAVAAIKNEDIPMSLRRFIKLLLIAGYVVVSAGLLFHTSTTHDVLGKYSAVYFACMVAFVLSFYPASKLMNFILSETTFNAHGKRPIVLRPIHKAAFYVIMLICMCAPFEWHLRHTKKEEATKRYRAMLDAYHPFLQIEAARSQVQKASALYDYDVKGREFARIKAPDVFRIIALGGSTVQSIEVDVEKSHMQLLEKRLAAQYPNRNVEVLNFGYSWHTSQHSLMKYLFRLSDYEPDMIIVWHGINDLIRSFLAPEFTYGPYQSDYSHFWGPNAYMVFYYHNHQMSQPEPIFRPNSQLLSLIVDFAALNLYTDITGETLPEQRSSVSPRGEGQSPAIPPYVRFRSISEFSRNMRRLVSIVKADDTVILMATQGNAYRMDGSDEELEKLTLHKQFCTENGVPVSIESMVSGMALFNEETRRIASDYDVAYVDLEKDIPKTAHYFTDDCHLTEAGNELVAESLFAHIVTSAVIVDR